jgi:hypothetical protein
VEETWTARDVYLLTEGAEGSIAVPDLELSFMAEGLHLDKADGEAVWDSPWSDLEEMSPVERSVLPDGREGVVMLVVERDRHRRHHFVLASDDPESTEADIRVRARAHGLETTSPPAPVSRPLIASIVATAAVVLTLLVLQAVHAIHL